jgi:hypothetical protein
MKVNLGTYDFMMVEQDSVDTKRILAENPLSDLVYIYDGGPTAVIVVREKILSVALNGIAPTMFDDVRTFEWNGSNATGFSVRRRTIDLMLHQIVNNLRNTPEPKRTYDHRKKNKYVKVLSVDVL